MKTLTIIDTFGYFFRAYYALPPLKSKSGFPTGLLRGFVNFLNQIFKEHSADYVAFALEGKEKGFREELFREYKANRPEAPDDLKKQLPIAIEWIEKMGFKNLSVGGYEADDVIASLAQRAKEQGIKVRIVSSDKDLYQLIDGDLITLFDPVKKIEIKREECLKKWGVEPKDFIEFQSILGDSSDNIPGVKGIGEKGASALVNEYGSLESIYENIDKITPARLQKLLCDGKENAFLSKKLVTLERGVFDSVDFSEFTLSESNPLFKIADELTIYDMQGALDQIKKTNNLPERTEAKKFVFEAILLDSDEKLMDTIKSIPQNATIALDTETNSLDTKSAQIVGFSFCFEKEAGYYVPLNHNYLGVGDQVSIEAAFKALHEIFKRPLIGHNLKFDLALLYRIFDLPQITPLCDTMVLAWLINPESSIGMDNLMQKYFSHKMIYFDDVVKKGQDFSGVNIEDACKYASEDAAATMALFFKLSETLSMQEGEDLAKEASEVEYPFVNTLINIEKEGLKLDISFFETLLEKSKNALTLLTEDIHALAGSSFNINSTQQLAQVLYERLGLKPAKKTKTGFSTNESVLEELEGEHAIIPKILEYREIFKLKSTYIEPLLEYAKKDTNSRIYTSLLHTGTATGRLSSKNPNLQNIPVKTELGREIRRGFIAKDGTLLLSIDYSQIELRLLAHFSQDSALLEAFNNDRDIHLETSKKIFGEERAKEMRNIAKSINFGLIYGMGARKLGDQIKVPQKEAKEYIDSYFSSFPTVKSYLKSIEEYALGHGYSQTLLGRRRHFSFEGVAEYQKAGFLREAVNTVFQGSAADLIKLSMLKADAYLKSKLSKMVLQIHDELLFEVHLDELEEIKKEITEIMENIYKLNVPLKCGVSVGKNWGELK